MRNDGMRYLPELLLPNWALRATKCVTVSHIRTEFRVDTAESIIYTVEVAYELLSVRSD
jgi:hypothetical protein